MKIYVFTLNGCGYCKKLKNTLDSNSISYIDVDVDENEDLWDIVVAQTGNDFVPTVYITNDDDDFGEVYVPDVDYKDDKEMLQIIKDLINLREK